MPKRGIGAGKYANHLYKLINMFINLKVACKVAINKLNRIICSGVLLSSQWVIFVH